MSVKLILGGQWGDEGKGKIVDVLSKDAHIVARFQGGGNAGHTINIGKRQFILHLIPSGILRPKVTAILGNGMVIDINELLSEIIELTNRNIGIQRRLIISDRAHVIFPFHKIQDKVKEELRGAKKIGTTGKGIGPCYLNKVGRDGIRIIDLIKPESIRQKISQDFKQLSTPQSIDKAMNAVYRFNACLEADVFRICNTSVFLQQVLGKEIILEGAQGSLLDLDHGTYPYVTSSNTIAGGACSGLGIGPNKINEILGVFKAYVTRVGEGPFPTELHNDYGKKLQQKGKEFGATTGRPRRCGYFDAVILKYSIIINGLTSLAITKLDVLDSLEKIKICTAYKLPDNTIINDYLPADTETLSQVTPIYETLPGWLTSTQKIRQRSNLPQNAQKYLERIEALADRPIDIISVGPKRSQTIFR